MYLRINNYMSRNLYLLALCFLFSMAAIAQQQRLLTPPVDDGAHSFNSNSILPPPVNASSINKGGDASVNLSVGTPNVAIPLMEVKSRYLGFPVSINYTSNGIKVDELASNVGLGWSLNCGGTLYRTTLGLPDEDRSQYNVDFTNFTKPDINTFDRATINYLAGTRDRESDVFQFSVNGFISGKFMLDGQGKPATLNADHYKINLLATNLRDGFEVIDEKGIKYIFNVADTSFFDKGGSCASSGIDRYKPIVNAWNISQIIMPGKDTINFQYITNTQSYIVDINEQESICVNSSTNACAGGSLHYACQVYSSDYKLCTSLQTINGKLLKEIDFVNGKLVFDYQDARKDVKGGASLEKITLSNAQGPIKSASFIHDYFKASGFDSFLRQNHISDSSLLYRLTLNKLTIDPGMTTTGKMEYNFSYQNGNNLPARLSASQDIYGFNNGIENRYMLTNAETEYPMNYYNLGYPRRYGDRSFRTDQMQYGLLNKITYPTGGSDTIIYDYNKRGEQYIQDHTVGRYIGIVGENVPDDQNVKTWLLDIPFSQNVDFSANIINITDPHVDDDRLHNKGYILIRNTATGDTIINYTVQLQLPHFDHIIYFPAATYEVIFRVTGGAVLNIAADFIYEGAPPDTLIRQVPMGGTRVAEIRSYDPVGNTALEKYYAYDGTFSILENTRSGYINPLTRFMTCEGVYDCSGQGECLYFVHSHNTAQPTSMLGGNILYNKSVTEYTIGKDSIQRAIAHKFSYVNTFSPRVDHGAVIANTPYGVYPDQLLGETETNYYSFNLLTGETKVQKREINTYDARSEELATNFVVNKVYESPCISDPPTSVEYDAFQINSYPILKMVNKLLSNKSITYASNGANDSLEVTTTYEYSTYAPAMPSKISSSSSKLTTMSQTYKYSFDNLSDPVSVQLVNKNKLLPVEIANYENSKSIKRNTIEYKAVNGSTDVIEPAKVNQQYGANALYALSDIQEFDKYGHPVTVLKDNALSCFIWDYQQCYVAAMVTNAVIKDVAYTGFEADGNGGWNVASNVRTTGATITGTRYYNLASGAITKTNADATQKYIVSYWTKNVSPLSVPGTQAGYPVKGKSTGGWTYYEHLVTGQSTISISGNGFIDELRLYPVTAQMVSYAYTPLVGVINQCDVKNNVISYEYDGLQRLKLVRDQDGKILKQFDYQYQQPITQ